MSKDLKTQILEILLVEKMEYHEDLEKVCKRLHFYRHNNGFRIEYGLEYESPELGFEKLLKLSELFGTTKINVDDFGIPGCESCDYGSCYGHQIDIFEATKNVQEAMKLFKQG